MTKISRDQITFYTLKQEMQVENFTRVIGKYKHLSSLKRAARRYKAKHGVATLLVERYQSSFTKFSI